MRIESSYSPALHPQAAEEVPGEGEPDGDSDDKTAKTSASLPANQIYKDGMGMRIDLMA